MAIITHDLLVEIVTQLATPSIPLVEAATIISYCSHNGIDLQGTGSANYAAFWDADLAEGAGEHRLQKFKRGKTRQARNAWCQFSDLTAGRVWASQNGWLLVPWNRTEQNWMFEFTGPADTTSPYYNND
jgi:hypothetical protein